MQRISFTNISVIMIATILGKTISGKYGSPFQRNYDPTVTMTETKRSGKRVVTMKIRGNGMKKNVEYISENGVDLVYMIEDGRMLAGNYFSNTEGTLINVFGKQCEKEIFKRQLGRYKSEIQIMSDQECQQVKNEMANMIKECKRRKKTKSL